MTKNTQVICGGIFTLFLLMVVCISLVIAIKSTECIVLGQEDNGDGRIETLYLGKCI